MIHNVNNVPAYATEYPVWVARRVDSELWFYGAYDTDTEASRAAMAVDGELVYNEG